MKKTNRIYIMIFDLRKLFLYGQKKIYYQKDIEVKTRQKKEERKKRVISMNYLLSSRSYEEENNIFYSK